MLAPKPSHTTSDASDPVPLSTMPLLAQAMVAVLRPRRKMATMTIVKVPLVKKTMKTKIAKVPNATMTMKTKIAKVPNAQMMTKRTRTMTKTMTKKYQTTPPPWLPPPLLLSSSLPLSSDQIENRV